METEYLEDGKNRFLRLKSGLDYESKYEIRMIHNNQPQGLLHMHISEGAGETCYDYSISGLSSLKELENGAEADYLYSVVFSLEQLSNVLFEYLLQQDKVLLDPEMIYLKRETGNVYFCYFPGKEESFQESLQSLIEYFLKVLNPKDEDKVLLLYGLYQKAREANVTMKTLAMFWREYVANHPSSGKAEYHSEPRKSRDPVLMRDDAGSAYGSANTGSRGYEERMYSSSGDKEARVFADLGLEKSSEEDAFMRWRAARRQENSEDELYIETEAREVEEKPEKTKMIDKIRPYALEIVAAAAVAAGILLYVFS